MVLGRPRIVFAGTASGVGKTTITTAFIAALCERGMHVQPFKVGPDYLDPSHLALAASHSCYNLDTWMMPRERVLNVFCRTTSPTSLAVIEGVMGLYDGQQSTSDLGSTAEIAKLLQAPVVLVIDASAIARSAAAVVLGFQHLDPDVHIVGVIANRVGGAGHARLLQEAIEPATGIPFLGYLSSHPYLSIPERHLGLVPVAEHTPNREHLKQFEVLFSQTCDVEKLLALAHDVAYLECNVDETFTITKTIHATTRIALAQDEAFHFYYPDTLELLQRAGAELVPFSPLHDQDVPAQIGGIYIGGGFPEVYAQELSANQTMRSRLAQLLAQDIPCYAECGGLMYLCQTIRVASGETFPMIGSIARQSVMKSDVESVIIGYREAIALRDTLLTRQGEVVRGHEFHFSLLDTPPTPEEAVYGFSGREQAEGFARRNLLASYLHLSLSSFPQAAERFVIAARQWYSSKATHHRI
ncbi:MAG: cobyrinate a,c-diamide synthase [Ktedonobacteraceae bacterium]